MSGFNTPITFLIFNRPGVTARVFQAIAAVRPQQLMVIADGPRADHPADGDRCAATRAIVDRIDWPCELHTEFSPINLGCGRRVASGLHSAFAVFDESIILEDDCLPHPDFFPYCEAMLDRYRDNDRVMHVGGDHFHGSDIAIDGSYYFSRFPHVWGWATWKRAWAHYQFELLDNPDEAEWSTLFADPIERAFWQDSADRVRSRRLDTWDVQWSIAMLRRGGLAINPRVNLIANLGFGPDATHTRSNSWMSTLATFPLGPLIHPREVIEHRSADSRTFEVVFGGSKLRNR